jgi:uncharacterized membrane protein YjgN (DUF898 family)
VGFNLLLIIGFVGLMAVLMLITSPGSPPIQETAGAAAAAPLPLQQLVAVLPIIILFVYLASMVVFLYFQAFSERFHWSHTSFRAVRFQNSLGGWQFTKLWLLNIVLLVFSLGLAWPWVHVRTMKMRLENLSLVGDVDPEKMAHEVSRPGVIGEGLADFFEFDFGFL